MGLGDRGKRRVKLNGSPSVDDLFKPTEEAAEAAQPETTENRKAQGRAGEAQNLHASFGVEPAAPAFRVRA